jgi:hypothetical protein
MIATIVACGGDKKNPNAPSGTAATNAAAGSGTNAGTNATNPDGSTLKVTAPTGLSPTGGQRVSSRRPTLAWTNAAGVYQPGTFTYQIELYRVNVLAGTIDVPSGSGTTAYEFTSDLDANTLYRWRVRAKLGTAVGPWSATSDFNTPGSVAPPVIGGGGGAVGPRTPDPVSGRLPLPNMSAVVDAVGRQYPAALRNSCQEHGGTWEFMDAVVDTLRANYDTRWGYNCKRGNCGDPSLDVITYHYGPGQDEGSKDVYIVDIIGGHCGSSPTTVWNDVTGVTAANGTSGGFTSRGRFGEGTLASGGSGGGGVSGGSLPPVMPGAPQPVNGRTPDPTSGYRLPLPSYAQAMVAQLAASAPNVNTQSCPRGIKYVNNPWQDYIIDGLRKIDSRWGYNAKPNRSAGDNGGVPVVAAGDEITYHWGSGRDEGSTEVYSIDILQSHCGSTPSLTWRDFTGEEPVIWTGAGRF